MDPSLFEQEEERALAVAVTTALSKVQPASATVTEFLAAMEPLAGPIDAYFEKVCIFFSLGHLGCVAAAVLAVGFMMSLDAVRLGMLYVACLCPIHTHTFARARRTTDHHWWCLTYAGNWVATLCL